MYIMKYDYVIVGSGLFGSVFANKATEAGKKCIIIEKKTRWECKNGRDRRNQC